MSATRNFSMQRYWMEKIKDWEPLFAFKGATQTDWQNWYKTAYPKFLELLGDFPEKVALNAEVEYAIEDGDLIRERVVFDSEACMSVPCQVLRPKTMKLDGTNAAIICSHGHGKYGKDPVAGIISTPEHAQDIKSMNYNYAEQMAKAGYLTITPRFKRIRRKTGRIGPFSGQRCLQC
ncbi:alpha/beta hydrolase family protein [Cohnella rhizosphaerae]|uniref:Uncharacterized protein n=1 Tax=Cohnella rhizosphaerae TaxID=1457232 RepID=A0A9X4QXK6_9BACL|nr:alpha/beta hydrolase family protein [Cohnella rhizosphaerae]MDG0813597.1 hypothetical protein [Cohnella rhizosphaerae]